MYFWLIEGLGKTQGLSAFVWKWKPNLNCILTNLNLFTTFSGLEHHFGMIF